MNNEKRAAVTELIAFYASSKKTDRTLVNKRDFYSLSYRYDGKVLVESNGESLLSTEGSVTFIPKGLSYTTEIIEDMHMAVVHFKLDEDIDFRNASVIDIHDSGVRLLFEKLIHNFHIDSRVDLHCMAVFYELLARLEDISVTENSKRIPDKIKLVREYIEKNYGDPALSVERIADSFHISTAYLRREFSRAYGISPITFLRGVRVGNAKNMLESGYLSIYEIAEQCGFSSTAYFIQVFHKLVGESPDRYRKSLHTK